jgi:hypothetical protein
MSPSSLRCGVLAGALVLFAFPVAAQFNGAIQGVVTDNSSAMITGATVTVTNVATGVSREVLTNAEGLYRVLSLGAGTYRVLAQMRGFQSVQRDQVEVGISDTVRVDFLLPLGTMSERVTVEAQAPQVETEQGRISGRVDQMQLKNLPLNGRNLFNLIALQPGIAGKGVSAALGAGGSGNDPYSGEANPVAYASGQRTEANSFTVDDSSVNSAARGGITNLTPNADSVEEVRVVANNFSAVDGRNSGAQVQVITKSGTNTFHGGVSYYFQNNTLASHSEFESKVPVFRRNQFAYNVGGPVIKNQTFFFTSFEGLRQSGARGAVSTVETPQFRDWVIQTHPNSIAAKLLRDFAPLTDPSYNFNTSAGAPRAGQVGPPAGMPVLGSAGFVPDSFRNGNQFTLRIDHELAPGKDRLSGNVYRTTSSTLNGGIRPAFNRPTDELTWFGSVTHTHTFGPNMLNEVRFNIMRLVGLPYVPAHLEVPAISITGNTGFGTNAFPQGWFQTNLNFKDVFSWIRSSHTIKMGGEIRRSRANSKNTNNYIPSFSFPTLLDFAYDDPLQETRKVDPRTGLPATNVVGLRGLEWALFVNDDWKVRRNLVINLGLRYENYGSPTEINGQLRNLVLGSGVGFFGSLVDAHAEIVPNFYPTDGKNFAPRVGFAWDPESKGRMSIRGGYGMAFDRLFMTPMLGFRDNPPMRADATLGRQLGTQAKYTLGDPAKPDFGYPLDPALQLGLDAHNGIKGVRVNMFAIDPNTTSSYVHNWFFGVQREVGRGVVIEANYLGSAGHHLYNMANVNRYRGDLLATGVFHGFNSSFNAISMISSTSNSIYHGGTIQARRMFGSSFSLQGAFTYGKVIDDADDLVNTANYLDIANRQLDRSLAGFDVSRKLAVVSVWDIPFLRGKRNLASAVLGSWQLSGMGIFQSGTPMTVTSSAPYPTGDFNADGTTGDRPNAPAAGFQTGGWERSAFLTGIFRAADFTIPQRGNDGTLGRNTFRGPGYAQVDLALSKNFRISERVHSQLRLDSFNAFNRVNLNNPSTDLTSNNFGKSTSAATPRAYQAGLRVTF